MGSTLSIVPSPLCSETIRLNLVTPISPFFFENDFVKTRSLFEVRKEGMRKTLIYKDVSVIHCSRDGIQLTRMKIFEEKKPLNCEAV